MKTVEDLRNESIQAALFEEERLSLIPDMDDEDEN